MPDKTFDYSDKQKFESFSDNDIATMIRVYEDLTNLQPGEYLPGHPQWNYDMASSGNNRQFLLEEIARGKKELHRRGSQSV